MRCFIGLFFALFATAIRADAPQTPSFHIVGNILYQTAEPSERADAYLPISASANSPAVIWMHGNHHDKTDSREKNICSQLAAAGYVAISINYGTWPDSDGGEEHSPRILQNIANARNAIRFFRAHATDYGIDPQRIALFGGSAGGWLSLMVGLTNGDASFDSTPPYSGVSSAVSAIGDFYADTDPWLKSKITPNSPPVLIIQGNADPAVDYHESIELDHLLANAGVPHQLLLLEGVGHGFDFTTWQKKPLPQDLLPVVLAFLKEHLALAAVAAVDTNDDPLTHLRKGHPRLLFTDEDLAKALAAAKTDPLRADLHKHIIATAEAILHAPPIRQPDRAQGQEQDRYAVYNILTCAMAYRLTGDERFFSRAKNDLLTAAVFPDWAPKHFLSVGEMSFASAIGYDWFYAKLTPDERTIIKKGLLQNSLSFAD
ncbi:MAG TPA: alpha/beta hydrolase, partial [Tepidisphaeraceae bacterium]|nr:alpha/beta hydrolase [Tepidisphaeraceae bacterium]